jgi:hypothetical protein
MRILNGTRTLRSLCLGMSTLLLVGLTAGACEDTTPTPLPTPTPPPTTTDTFSGTLNINGAFTFPFQGLAAGSMTGTLTTLSDTTKAISLALGTWNGVSCQIVVVNDKATQGAIVTAVSSGGGSFCARVSDVGMLTESVTFEIAVVHP